MSITKIMKRWQEVPTKEKIVGAIFKARRRNTGKLLNNWQISS